MIVRSARETTPFIANDGCLLTELLHPKDFPSGINVTLGFSLAVAEVEVGGATYRHVLEQDEVYYLLSGQGEVYVDADSAILNSGDAVLIPAGSIQWIKNIGKVPLKFIAVVSPPWSADKDRRI